MPSTALTSPSRPTPGRSTDARMLAQQQARLLRGMSRLLSRLLRSLLWDELEPNERRRAVAFLARVEHDLELTRLVAKRPFPRGVPSGKDLEARVQSHG